MFPFVLDFESLSQVEIKGVQCSQFSLTGRTPERAENTRPSLAEPLPSAVGQCCRVKCAWPKGIFMLFAWRKCWAGPPQQPSAALSLLAAALCGGLRHGHSGLLHSRFVAFGPPVVWVSLPARTEGDRHSETRRLRAASQGWVRVRPRCFAPPTRSRPQEPRGAPAGIGAHGEWGLHQSHLPRAALGLVQPHLAP